MEGPTCKAESHRRRSEMIDQDSQQSHQDRRCRAGTAAARARNLEGRHSRESGRLKGPVIKNCLSAITEVGPKPIGLLTVLNTGQPTRISSINSKTQSVIDLSIVTKELALNCKHYVTN